MADKKSSPANYESAHAYCKMLLAPCISFDSTDLITSDLDQLTAAAPEFNPEYVASIYELSNMNFATTFNCFLIDNHGTLHAVLEMMKIYDGI